MEIVLKNPFALLLLLIIPILFMLHYYFFEHNKRKAMKFSNFIAMKRVTGTHLITKNTGQLIIRIVCIAILTLGISQPVIWYSGMTSNSDYVIALDTSASMISADVLPTRLDVAKQSATNFIDSLKAESKVGLVTFAGASYIRKPLEKDLGKVKDAIKATQLEMSGGTDIGSALVTSSNLLIPGDKSKVIILITDGSDTSGTFVEESVDTALNYVIDNHMIIYTIGIGTEKGNPGYVEGINLPPVYDEGTLKQIAEQTGGKFYHTENSAELSVAFMDITSKNLQGKVSMELSTLFLGLGMLILLFEWGILNTRFRALP